MSIGSNIEYKAHNTTDMYNFQLKSLFNLYLSMLILL